MTTSALSLPNALPSPLNFEAYARAVQKLPYLDEEQEQTLALAWRDRQDKLAAWELVMAHLRLVVKVVREQAGYGLSPGDLAQEGTVGLMKAVHRFDPARGIRLASYAVKWIEAEVREYIMRNWRLVRLGTGAAMKKLFFGYRKALAHLRQWGDERDVTPSVQALAQVLNLDEHQVQQAQAYFSGHDEALEVPSDDANREERRDLHHGFMASRQADPAWVAETTDQSHHQHAALTQAMATLPARDRAILTARLLQEPPVGLVELGRKHGVSAERVRQIEKRALADLREQLAPLAP